VPDFAPCVSFFVVFYRTKWGKTLRIITRNENCAYKSQYGCVLNYFNWSTFKSQANSQSRGSSLLATSPIILYITVYLNAKCTLKMMDSHITQCGKLKLTRKPRYRKDDRAMCPIYGCPENFWKSLTHGYFLEIFNGLLFRLSLWMCLQNLKFVALPVPEIIGVPQKFGQSPDMPTLPVLQIFDRLSFRWTLWMYWPNFTFDSFNS